MTIVDQFYGYKYLIRQSGIRCKTTRSIGRILLWKSGSLENKQQTRCLYAAIIELGAVLSKFMILD